MQTGLFGPVSLQLAAGECVGLSGASGAGKSLLLRALADLDPSAGAVLLDGIQADQLPPAQWRRKVALVPAEPAWWGATVGEHLPRDATDPGDDAKANDMLARLGFGPEVRNWAVSRCSTGERQRLALVRALLNRPQVLLLDEPTGNLDAASTASVEALLARLCQQQQLAVLWVSHDTAQLARVATRQFCLRDGRLHADSGDMSVTPDESPGGAL